MKPSTFLKCVPVGSYNTGFTPLLYEVIVGRRMIALPGKKAEVMKDRNGTLEQQRQDG